MVREYSIHFPEYLGKSNLSSKGENVAPSLSLTLYLSIFYLFFLTHVQSFFLSMSLFRSIRLFITLSRTSCSFLFSPNPLAHWRGKYYPPFLPLVLCPLFNFLTFCCRCPWRKKLLYRLLVIKLGLKKQSPRTPCVMTRKISHD